jgi:hypothetical protein
LENHLPAAKQCQREQRWCCLEHEHVNANKNTGLLLDYYAVNFARNWRVPIKKQKAAGHLTSAAKNRLDVLRGQAGQVRFDGAAKKTKKKSVETIATWANIP